MTGPKIFIAGSTGSTGRTLLERFGQDADDLVPHLRPKTAARHSSVDSRAAVVDLGDHDALVEALQPCETVIQLIGTMQKRFKSGDTYETSDIGTTRQLVDASKVAGIEHLVLLSSVGAGRPIGAYLKAKAEAERIVVDSGIKYTIFRPSAFNGAGHRAPPGMGFLTKTFGLDRYRPMPIEDLARTILRVARARAPLDAILEGASLWAEVDRR